MLYESVHIILKNTVFPLWKQAPLYFFFVLLFLEKYWNLNLTKNFGIKYLCLQVVFFIKESGKISQDLSWLKIFALV